MSQSGLRGSKMIQNDHYNMFLTIWRHFGPIWTILNHFRQNLIFYLKNTKCFLAKAISESCVCSERIPLVPARKNFPIESFRVQSVLPKKSIFRQFPCINIKDMLRARVHSIWCWCWPGVNRLPSRAFQSQVTQICANRRFWGVFFVQNRFSWLNG